MVRFVSNEKTLVRSTTESSYSSSEDDFSEGLPAYKPINNTHGQKHFVLELGSFPWRDVVVKSNDGSVAYFADISEFKPNAPDVTLRAGGKDGPTVGTAFFRWSRSIRAGVGTNELDSNWVEMKRAGTLNTKRFDFIWEGHSYSLRRARDPEKGVKMMSHYQIVREMGGEVVGSYTNEISPGRLKGTLDMAEGTGRELEVLIILGVVSWREKARRRQTRHGGSHGGGGG